MHFNGHITSFFKIVDMHIIQMRPNVIQIITMQRKTNAVFFVLTRGMHNF